MRSTISSILLICGAERASLTARGRQAENEAAPIRYVAQLVWTDTDSERVVRGPIALPLAIALTAAAWARRSTTVEDIGP
jgi:hypothetical protein